MSTLYDRKPWLQHYHVAHTLPLPTMTLRESFRENAAARPQTTAIQYFDRSISFAELDDLSDRMAAVLARMGVGRGDRVALSLQNNPQFAIVGGMEAGGGGGAAESYV